MKIKLVITILLLILPLKSAVAFDGKREGYIMELDFGLNSSSLIIKSGGTTSDYSTSGFATTARIGYGFDNKLVMFLERVDSFFYLTENTNDNLWNSSLTGIGLSCFFLDKLSSPYFSVSYGYGEMQTMGEEDFERYHGDAYKIGIGYQSENHLGVELSAMRKELGRGGKTIVSESILVTFNLLFF